MFLTDLCSSGSSVYRVYTQQCGRNLLKLFYNGNVCSLHKVCDNTMGRGAVITLILWQKKMFLPYKILLPFYFTTVPVYHYVLITTSSLR